MLGGAFARLAAACDRGRARVAASTSNVKPHQYAHVLAGFIIDARTRCGEKCRFLTMACAAYYRIVIDEKKSSVI